MGHGLPFYREIARAGVHLGLGHLVWSVWRLRDDRVAVFVPGDHQAASKRVHGFRYRISLADSSIGGIGYAGTSQRPVALLLRGESCTTSGF